MYTTGCKFCYLKETPPHIVQALIKRFAEVVVVQISFCSNKTAHTTMNFRAMVALKGDCIKKLSGSQCIKCAIFFPFLVQMQPRPLPPRFRCQRQ